MSRLGVEFSDDELEEMVNRSNKDILEALISIFSVHTPKLGPKLGQSYVIKSPP